MNYIVLKNEFTEVKIHPESGALCGLRFFRPDWGIFDREELGLGFRLLVPLSEEKRNNNVYGERQKLAGAELSADGTLLTLLWDGVTSENTGLLPIKVKQSLRLWGAELQIETEIDNGSPYMVETVYAPYLGDIRTLRQKNFQLHTPLYSSFASYRLWPKYQNIHGYFGVDYPTQYVSAGVMSPFALVCTEEGGLYVGHGNMDFACTAWHTELRPGYSNSIDQSVPKEDFIGGKPVHTRFGVVHQAYIQPGEQRKLTPVMLQAYEGDWHKGADIYKAWRDARMTVHPCAHWVNEPHAWLQIQMNSPEDELRFPFTKLPEIAAECKKYGVKAIQLVGWNDGGQDQGNPSHDFDPRLGTLEEFKAAIAACREMGVEIILFTKFTWADRATDWFRRELKNYAVRDPYGDYYLHGGYQYQTAAQLLDINPKRLVPMCFNSEEYLKICEKEFAKVVSYGAAGMLFDECFHHWPTRACFDTSHGHRYGMSTSAGDLRLIERLRPLAPTDFMVSGEACYDYEMQQYEVSYFRTEHKDHIPVYSYVLPQGKYMTAVTGFDDRDMLNQCLMYHYIVSYEPYNFKGRLPDYPDTMAYGMQMHALRSECRKWLWEGTFLHTIGGKAETADGKPYGKYGVFRAEDDSLAMVVTNYEDAPVTVKAWPEAGAPFARYRLVDGEGWQELPVEGITLPPHSSAVLLQT